MLCLLILVYLTALLFLKELRRSGKLHKAKASDDDCVGGDSKGTIKLYGKWQLEPLCLPLAVNGIVPKVLSHNENANGLETTID